MFCNKSGLLHAISFYLPRVIVSLAMLVVSLGTARGSFSEQTAADWPMWRYDAQRSAASPISLPQPLSLQWARELPKPSRAWPEEQTKLQFDRSYEPVVWGDQIFVGSMGQDSITAYAIESGRENWRFYCDGPIRFAPVAWQGKIYITSDDGHLYCLEAATGRQLWRLALAPSGQRVLGNGRIISAWPARGGPVLKDGTLYCAAGIWPFMGIFITAVDASSGRVLWENSGAGSIYTRQQHSSDAFAGVAPQGYLVATEENLLVPSRTVPACFRRDNGNLRYYHLANRDQGKYVGGYNVAIWKDWFFNNGTACRLADGQVLARIPFGVSGSASYFAVDVNDRLTAYTFTEQEQVTAKKKKKTTLAADTHWQAPSSGFAFHRVHCQAGQHLYASNDKGAVAAVTIPQPGQKPEICWRDNVPGKVWTMLAAQGRLFVVTEQGGLYCYGAKSGPALWYRNKSLRLPKATREIREVTRRLLAPPTDRHGYALWLGLRDRRLLRDVVRQSDLHIIVLEPNTDRVLTLRQEYDQAGLYGTRITVLPGTIRSLQMPPYFARLVVVEDVKAAGIEGEASVTRLYQILRPYGGRAWLSLPKDQQLSIIGDIRTARLPGCQVFDLANGMCVQRNGPLPGSANWTHQYGNVANTASSYDQLKLPLGLLWFGEEARFGEVLPRHGHGPAPQVAAGRLFIQGIHSLSARDVYTGQTLWTRRWPNLGTAGIY